MINVYLTLTRTKPFLVPANNDIVITLLRYCQQGGVENPEANTVVRIALAGRRWFGLV
jgi:hypothetical protein